MKSKKITKVLFVSLIFTCSLLLGGCWDRKETQDLAIVLSTAIDKSKNQTKVSVQVLIPQGAVSDGHHGMGGDQSTLVRSALGKNVADAMSKIQGKTSRKLFWGQCRVYIFGEQVAKDGLYDEIDFLVRHPEPRTRSYLFVSKGDAADLLKVAPLLEGFLGKSLRKLVDERVGAVVTLKDFQQMITSEAGGAILPFINTKAFKKVEEDNSMDPILATAIFKQDKMVGTIDQKLTKGVLWLTNDVHSSAITVSPPKTGGTITMDPINSHTSLVPSINKNKWKINAKITAEGSIVQNATNLNVMNPKVNKMLQKELDKAIKLRINQSLQMVQKEMKVDVFHFAETFERKYPHKWDQSKDRWDEILPQVEVQFDIQSNVRRPGLSTRPGGLPNQEVKMK